MLTGEEKWGGFIGEEKVWWVVGGVEGEGEMYRWVDEGDEEVLGYYLKLIKWGSIVYKYYQ